jgi:uncharacterized membrane protein YhaH (DUF805 family)
MASMTAAQPAGEGFFAHLFNPSGRTNRAKWWLSVLLYMILYAIALALLYALSTQGMEILGGVIMAVVGVGILVSSILIAIRRLHDRDKSGHWLWLLYVLPGVVSGIGNVLVLVVATTEALLIGMLLSLGSLGFSIWALVWLGCLRGTQGPNRFGPDPVQS